MAKMRTIVARKNDEIIHIETSLGLVNIYLGLHDRLGRRVENVSITPNSIVGVQRVVRRGSRIVELKSKR